MATSTPRVLVVYYTYTQQTRLVAEAIAVVRRDRGCEVQPAALGFTDKRWAERFSRTPLRHVYRDILGMLPAQLRGATGEIQIPDAAHGANYDLICTGSPTWLFAPSVPIRSFLKSEVAERLFEGKRFGAFVVCRRYWSINPRSVRRLGAKQGGEYTCGTRFTSDGGQVRSLLSLLSYFGKGENSGRYLGLTIPPCGLKRDYREQARVFANELADDLQQLNNGKAG